MSQNPLVSNIKNNIYVITGQVSSQFELMVNELVKNYEAQITELQRQLAEKNKTKQDK